MGGGIVGGVEFTMGVRRVGGGVDPSGREGSESS